MYSRICEALVGELLGSRCLIFLLLTIGSLFIAVSTVNSRSLCRNTTETVLLDFVPCALNGSSRSMLTATAREILDRCDVLVQAAMHLAVERLNQSPDVLANTILHVHNVTVQPLDFTKDEAFIAVADLLRSHVFEYYGVIGPGSSLLADFWTPIFHRLDLLMISYAVTSKGPDETLSFYRTLPSSRSANIGRLLLLIRNGWFRIASISSNETFYAKEAEEFAQFFKEPVCDRRIELVLPSMFSDSPLTALSDIRGKDVNIIVGFFGPERAREVLCMAESEGLVSDDHAWVLPSYYSPNWWKQSASGKETSDCSDGQMRKILETVIFIDTVKFPPMDKSMASFHGQLLSKAHELYPSVTVEDLKPYLFHSRSTNAYDAVNLLARSVGVAFDQVSGDDCANSSQIQLALEKVYMCEYCRLHFGCQHNDGRNKMNWCMDICNPNFTAPKRFTNISTSKDDFAELRANHLLHSFGQVFYSQFTGGINCPVGLLWTSSDVLVNSSLVCGEHIYTLEELDKAQCAVRLNLSKELFMRDGCPLTFQWRGSLIPPSSHFETKLTLPLAEIIFIGVVTSLGLVMAMALIVFNIVWRSNKIVRASSPWLNAVLLVGIIIWLPSALFNSLAVSSIEYGFDQEYSNALCHLEAWFYYHGEAIFLATMIAKNWRIYRIFSNKSLKMIGNELSDNHLVIFILLLLLPVLIILIVWSSFHIQLETPLIQNKNLELIQIAVCTSDYLIKFRITLRSYMAILLLTLFVLTFLVLRTTMSAFRREGTLSYVVMSVALFPLPIIDVVHTFATTGDVFMTTMVHLIFVWIEFTQGVLFPLLIMSVLFLPNVYLVLIKEHLETRLCTTKKGAELLASEELSSRYHSLRLQAASLKQQLYETDQLITQFLQHKQHTLNKERNHLKDSTSCKCNKSGMPT